MSEIVITGGGVAAASVAQTLRAEGYDGEIHLYAEEPHSPYQRPPLSKGYLSGTEGADAVVLHSDAWYADSDRGRLYRSDHELRRYLRLGRYRDEHRGACHRF